VRPEGLGKFKNSPHRVSNPRPMAISKRKRKRRRECEGDETCKGVARDSFANVEVVVNDTQKHYRTNI
jgi:hypothetical protein